VPHVGGPILPPCCPTVLTGSMPQARVSDMATCVGPPDVIVLGSFTVLVSGLPAARLGDLTAHGGAIVLGFPTVLIGRHHELALSPQPGLCSSPIFRRAVSQFGVVATSLSVT